MVAALAGVTGCITVPQVPQRDYSSAMVGTWLYTGTVLYPFHGTYREEHIPSAIVTFHSDGRLGNRSLADPSADEYIAGKRWRIEGDKLFVIPDQYTSRDDRALANNNPSRIVLFTPDKIVAVLAGVTDTYTRIRKQRDAPNQTMQRTPTRRSLQTSND
jgi:hypothetical protein